MTGVSVPNPEVFTFDGNSYLDITYIPDELEDTKIEIYVKPDTIQSHTFFSTLATEFPDVLAQFSLANGGGAQAYVMGTSTGPLGDPPTIDTEYIVEYSYPGGTGDGRLLIKETDGTELSDYTLTRGGSAGEGVALTIGRYQVYGGNAGYFDGSLRKMKIWEGTDPILINDIAINEGSNTIYDRVSDETYTLVPDTGTWS